MAHHTTRQSASRDLRLAASVAAITALVMGEWMIRRERAQREKERRKWVTFVQALHESRDARNTEE